ncbi:hypothetical protein KY362_06810, partial [Candidatus Woesearchaeota archaeon]|nr:hypothetical protein [Candidatus Woesearchaeota archaeon]
ADNEGLFQYESINVFEYVEQCNAEEEVRIYLEGQRDDRSWEMIRPEIQDKNFFDNYGSAAYRIVRGVFMTTDETYPSCTSLPPQSEEAREEMVLPGYDFSMRVDLSDAEAENVYARQTRPADIDALRRCMVTEVMVLSREKMLEDMLDQDN